MIEQLRNELTYQQNQMDKKDELVKEQSHKVE